MTLPLAKAAEGKGLTKVWARRKISDAEVARNLRQVSPDDTDKTILKLALAHQLVTRLTSLVAVDQTPSRPAGEPLKLVDLPLNLPAGWDFAKVFGEQGHRPAQPVERRAEDSARTQLASLKRPAVVAAPSTITLPKTATDAELRMMAGLVLLALGMILLVTSRRRQFAQ